MSSSMTTSLFSSNSLPLGASTAVPQTLASVRQTSHVPPQSDAPSRASMGHASSLLSDAPMLVSPAPRLTPDTIHVTADVEGGRTVFNVMAQTSGGAVFELYRFPPPSAFDAYAASASVGKDSSAQSFSRSLVA